MDLKELLGQRVAEGHREHQAQLVSLDLPDESDPQVHLAPLDQLDLLVCLGKRDHLDYAETMDLQVARVKEAKLVLLVAPETKEMAERMDLRVLMDHQALLVQQDKGELWVFLVKEESVECLDFQGQRVLQENKDLPVPQVIKDPLDQWVCQVQTDPVETLDLQVSLVLMDHQERME